MATRSVVVRLEAEVARFVANMDRATKSADQTAKAAERSGKASEDASKRSSRSSQEQSDASRKATEQAEKQAAATDKLSSSLLKIGVGGVAALGLATKAAMDWESAWTGVTKTVDGTPAEMAAIEDGLRSLAKTLPSTHQEIAAVAEAAGQLGVARKDIVGFTKTMIDLSVSTNLTADEAATNIAQISNIMGTMARDGAEGVSRFGATLVALGNDGASTEKDILSMAQRIAGAGKTAGATEADVLALANTLSSMGVRAELGGGVATRVLLKMNSAFRAGGEDLGVWAKAAGVSAETFSKAFQDSPMRALQLVATGLAKVNASGGDVSSTLKDLGLKGTEEAQVMLALASSGDLLTKSLDLGKTAWEQNSALAVEAGKRYETAESKVKVAWNNIQDSAIDAGAVLLPTVAKVAETAANIGKAFGDLPAPIQGGVVAFGAITTAGALLVGGGIKVLGTVRDIRATFEDLNSTGSKLPGTLGSIGKAAGIAAGAYAALATAAALVASNQKDVTTSSTTFINALSGGAKNSTASAKAISDAFKGVSNDYDVLGRKVENTSGTLSTEVNSLGDAMKRVFNPNLNDNLNDFFYKTFGQEAASGMAKTKAAIGDLDKAIASMATSGNVQDAAAGFREVVKAAEAEGKTIQDVIPLFPQYRDAVTAVLNANGENQASTERVAQAMRDGIQPTKDATGANKELKGSTQGAGEAAAEAQKKIEDFVGALKGMVEGAASARQAEVDFNSAIRDAGDAAKEAAVGALGLGSVLNSTKTDFDLTTEAGGKANSAFMRIAQEGAATLEAKAKEGAGLPELQTSLKQTYDALVTAGVGFGLTANGAKNAKGEMEYTSGAAVDLARKILNIPKGVDIKTWMSDAARVEANKTKGAADAVDGKQVRIGSSMSDAALRMAEQTLTTIRTLDGSVATVSVRQIADNYVDTPQGTMKRPGRAMGGAILGPGPKGVDSLHYMLAPGEHVLTAREVDAMGGQQAVYAFRARLRNGGDEPIYRAANGGAVGDSRWVAAREMRTVVQSVTAPSGAGRSFTQIVHGVNNPAALAHYTRQIEDGNVVIEGSRLG